MSPAEGLVLVVAAILAGALFVESAKGTLAPRAGALLSALATLAAVAAFLRMSGR